MIVLEPGKRWRALVSRKLCAHEVHGSGWDYPRASGDCPVACADAPRTDPMRRESGMREVVGEEEREVEERGGPTLFRGCFQVGVEINIEPESRLPSSC